MPFVTGALSNTSKTDIVWDYYRPESLKDVTRRKRGKGVRKKVAGHVFTYIHTLLQLPKEGFSVTRLLIN